MFDKIDCKFFADVLFSITMQQESVAEKHPLRPVMYVSLDCCNGNTAARSCHPSFFISCCLTLVASKTGKPSLSASLCKPFRRAVGIGHWHRYIQVHVHGIRYIYRYIISRSWLETINPSRRDVIAIFGPLIGSLHGQICGDDIT